jgi:two-component system, chemotaxis family, CheB/CheR fusion protein
MSDNPQKAEPETTSGENLPLPNNDLLVVGVGASAGGLEALGELLSALPSGLNMALVVVQHLDPHHESVLPELLSGKTAMQVVPVQQETSILPGRVYVISPNTILLIRNRRLVLATRPVES